MGQEMGWAGWMAENVHEFFLTVEAAVIDGNGHVNNVAYLEWMQRAA